MDPAEAQLYIGQVLGGRYEVRSFRASGAFSGVFLSVDQNTSREVATKILSLASSQNQSAVLEFEEEKRLLGVLCDCSNIVDLLDVGQHVLQIQVAGGTGTLPIPVSYMILEYAEASLAELLTRRHSIAWTDRLGLYRDVVKGTHQMHLGRLVHRDVKSDNVLVIGAKSPIAKLSDLGRSKDTREPHRAGKLDYQVGRGDPNFAPPEYLWMLGEADPIAQMRGDLYLLGSVLFELAVGVGLTALVLGNPGSVWVQALAVTDEKQRAQQYRSNIADLRDQYELGYELFRSELPRPIAAEGTELLRQLTDPDPLLRVPRRPFRSLPVYWDLQWLLRRVDILAARLAVPPRRARRRIKAAQKGSTP